MLRFPVVRHRRRRGDAGRLCSPRYQMRRGIQTV
jgi:hypothetical protein